MLRPLMQSMNNWPIGTRKGNARCDRVRPSLQEAQLRHAQHYETVLRSINELYLEGGTALKIGLSQFNLERSNIDLGRSWAHALSESDKRAAKLCSSYPRVGAALLNLLLPARVRISWGQAGMVAAQRLGDRRAESRHLGDLGAAHVTLGKTEAAFEYLRRQLEVARESNDLSGQASAWGNLGNAFMAERDPRRAAENYGQALNAYRQLGFRRGEADALNNLGVTHKDLGEFENAIRYHQDGLAICREIGYRRGQGQNLNNLAIVYRKIGEYEKAANICHQALAIFREIGDRLGEAQAIWSAAKTNDTLGKEADAISAGEAALAIFEELQTRQAARVRATLTAWQARSSTRPQDQ
jgi:tetratricopeptide (TPR) repeat protein